MKTAALLLLALLAAPARATVTVSVSTSGPTSPFSIVTSTPSGIICPPTCSASFSSSTAMTLGEYSASTVAFAGWTGARGCRHNQQSCNFTPLINTNVGAVFDPTLTLGISGNGIGLVKSSGSVSCSVPGSCDLGATVTYVYPKGTTIMLQESTGPASSFTGWTGDGGCSTASTCTVTLNGSETIIATFTANGGPYTIAIEIPTGGGRVFSTPAGISCGDTNTACSASFSGASTFTLTAYPDSAYRFAGWAFAGQSSTQTAVVLTSSSPLQGTGGYFTPAAYFYHQ